MSNDLSEKSVAELSLDGSDNGVSLSSIKGLIMEMGVALADNGYVWSNKMRTAFNKAVKLLNNKDIFLTS